MIKRLWQLFRCCKGHLNRLQKIAKTGREGLLKNRAKRIMKSMKLSCRQRYEWGSCNKVLCSAHKISWKSNHIEWVCIVLLSTIKCLIFLFPSAAALYDYYHFWLCCIQAQVLNINFPSHNNKCKWTIDQFDIFSVLFVKFMQFFVCVCIE